MGPQVVASTATVAAERTLASPYLLVLLASFAVVAAVAVLTSRRLDEPGAREFLVLLVCVGAWQATAAVGLVSSSTGLRLVWEKLTWAFPTVLPVLWLAFALAYTGSGHLSRRQAGLLLVPALVAQPIVWLDPVPLAWYDVDYTAAAGVYLADQQSGPLSLSLFAYTALLTLIGSGVLVRFSLTARYLYWDQAASLGIGAVAPVVVALLSIADLTPLPGLNLTPYVFGVSALLFGNALFRYGFLDHVPATRRIGDGVVTDCIRDGVVVVDDADRIVRANPVAEAALGRDETALLGEDLWAVLPSAGLGDDGLGPRAIYRAPTDGRVYELDDTPLTDQHDRTIGHVLLFRDVTGRENREQRLAVLNRTLRHNLRNEMNIVEGYADQLAESLEGDEAELAATVRGVAADLVDLSTKARDAETVMAGRTETPDPAHLGELLETTVEALPDGHGAAVAVDTPANVYVPGTDTFHAVLYNAVENATVHGAEPDGEVRVDVDRDDDRVAIAVADDGPGIPETELSAVEDGIETQLEHGSGLGLWIITWGARSLGGGVEFDTDRDGTTVTITVPAATGAEPTGAAADRGRIVESLAESDR
jgi:signal transduction histidine kinase